MFKPCKGCPTPAKCKSMGSCAAKKAVKKPTRRGQRTKPNKTKRKK